MPLACHDWLPVCGASLSWWEAFGVCDNRSPAIRIPTAALRGGMLSSMTTPLGSHLPL
jgi:hypothetical protein